MLTDIEESDCVITAIVSESVSVETEDVDVKSTKLMVQISSGQKLSKVNNMRLI